MQTDATTTLTQFQKMTNAALERKKKIKRNEYHIHMTYFKTHFWRYYFTPQYFHYTTSWNFTSQKLGFSKIRVLKNPPIFFMLVEFIPKCWDLCGFSAQIFFFFSIHNLPTNDGNNPNFGCLFGRENKQEKVFKKYDELSPH